MWMFDVLFLYVLYCCRWCFVSFASCLMSRGWKSKSESSFIWCIAYIHKYAYMNSVRDERGPHPIGWAHISPLGDGGTRVDGEGSKFGHWAPERLLSTPCSLWGSDKTLFIIIRINIIINNVIVKFPFKGQKYRRNNNYYVALLILLLFKSWHKQSFKKFTINNLWNYMDLE